MARRKRKKDDARAAIAARRGNGRVRRPHRVVVSLSDAERTLLDRARELASDAHPRAMLLAAANAVLLDAGEVR